jgi:cytidylate kinase
MEDLLMQYLKGQVRVNKIPATHPLITIRREHGCNAVDFAEKLAKAINKQLKDKKSPEWNWISKEIIENAAAELRLQPGSVDNIISSTNKNIFENVILGFSNDYVSSLKMKNTIKNVIKTYADKGNVIIVGRGGGAILSDYSDALHIKLSAPEEWRAEKTAERCNISLAKAKIIVRDVDTARNHFVECFTGKKHDSFFYHLVLNCAKLSMEEMVESVLLLMKMRKIL